MKSIKIYFLVPYYRYVDLKKNLVVFNIMLFYMRMIIKLIDKTFII
jgi:hypothetical protein